MSETFDVILNILQKNDLLACYWILFVFEFHQVNGKLNIKEDKLIAEVEISELKLQKLLTSLETRKIKYEVVSRS